MKIVIWTEAFMQQVLLYHGSGETVIFSEIRKTIYTGDFMDILLYKEWTDKWIIKRKMMFFMYVPLLNLLQERLKTTIRMWWAGLQRKQ